MTQVTMKCYLKLRFTIVMDKGSNLAFKHQFSTSLSCCLFTVSHHFFFNLSMCIRLQFYSYSKRHVVIVETLYLQLSYRHHVKSSRSFTALNNFALISSAGSSCQGIRKVYCKLLLSFWYVNCVVLLGKLLNQRHDQFPT